MDIVIVGNTNVGKSFLFNRICGEDFALVYNKENTTLDYISVYVGKHKITDTAGINKYSEWLNLYGDKVLQNADLILYVCDVSQPVTYEMEQLYRNICKYKKDIWIIVNKSDKKPHADFSLSKLQSSKVIYTSCMEPATIRNLLKELSIEQTENINENIVAIVGRANAGKSTLMNKIIREQRVITSAIPGTTVDHIYEQRTINEVPITFVDTPGLAHSKESDFIHVINKRREKLLQNSFIGQIVLIDGEIGVTRQDKAVLENAKNIGLFTIVCINKADNCVSDIKEQIKYMSIPSHIQVFYISALQGQGIKNVLQALTTSIKNFHAFSTSQLNKCLENIKTRPNVPHLINQIKYVVQTSTSPLTILYFSKIPLNMHTMKAFKKYIMEYFNILNYRIYLKHSD